MKGHKLMVQKSCLKLLLSKREGGQRRSVYINIRKTCDDNCGN